MRFRFPVVIIDEDFRSENASGLGIRTLAEAIEKEGMEVLGVTNYGDLTSFAQQQARASAFVLSIDDEELAGSAEDAQAGAAEAARLRRGSALPQCRNPDFPARRNAHRAPYPERHPARAQRLHPHAGRHAGISRPLYRPRSARLPRFPGAAVFPRADPLRGGRLVFLALPRPFRRRGLPEVADRPDVPPVLRREPAARRRLQRGRRTRATARPHRSGGGVGAQRGAHLQLRPPVLRHQRHLVVQQDGVARHGRAGRHRRGRPQLPQVHPARHHDVRRDPDFPDADAQPLRHHRADSAGRIPTGKHREENRRASVRQGCEAQAAHPDHHPVDLRRHPLQRRHDQGTARRLHRHPAFRRSLAAARDLPRFLSRHARHRQGSPARQGCAGVRHPVDAQAAGRT